MSEKRVSKEELQKAIGYESKKFEECFLWIEKHMPPSFFEEIDRESILLVAHSLIGFDKQNFFCHIHLNDAAIALCLDSPDADLKILDHYRKVGIKNYRTFVSNEPPPFPGAKAPLRIAAIFFTAYVEKRETGKGFLAPEKEREIFELVRVRNADVNENVFHSLLSSLSPRILRSLTKDRLVMELDMFQRAKTRDTCQYEVKRNEELKYPGTASTNACDANVRLPGRRFAGSQLRLVLYRKAVRTCGPGEQNQRRLTW